MLSVKETPPSTWRHTQLKVSTRRVEVWYLYLLFSSEPSIGELRYIARLNADLLPNEEPFGDVSTTAGGTVIEGSDVVSFP